MSDHIDTREGWREVSEKATTTFSGDQVSFWDATAQAWRYWVREEPVPPLPTEPYTVIRVTWRQGYDANPYFWLHAGVWDNGFGMRKPDILQADITGFEVLSEPRARFDALQEEVDRLRDLLREEQDEMRRETAKAVLDRVREEFADLRWAQDRLGEIYTEHGVES